MNEQQQYSDYLGSLQNAEREQGQVKLRTLALQFQSTLSRLPALQQEMDSFLQTHEALDYEALVQQLQPVLQNVSDWLVDLDNFSIELESNAEMENYRQNALLKINLANANKLIENFYNFQHELIEKTKSENERLQQEEIKRKAEEEKLQRELEDEKEDLELLLEWCFENRQGHDYPKNIKELKGLIARRLGRAIAKPRKYG